MNIEKLRPFVGQEIHNYKKMCEILGEKEKGGHSKDSQTDEWRRYINYERQGHKYIIKEIFSEPKPKQDKRTEGNNQKYIEHIQPLLLHLLAQQPDFCLNDTKISLCKSLGMANDLFNILKKDNLYNDIHNNKLTLESKDLKTISSDDIKNFYARSDEILKRTLMNALNSLTKNKKIEYSNEIMLVELDGETRLAVNEKSIVLGIRTEVMQEMNCSKMFVVKIRDKLGEYYQTVNMYLLKELGCKKAFDVLKIKALDPFFISTDELNKQQVLLNEKIIDAINKNAQRSYDRYNEEYIISYEDDEEDEEDDEGWGEKNWGSIDVKFPYKYGEDYIKNQEMLAELLVKVKNRAF